MSDTEKTLGFTELPPGFLDELKANFNAILYLLTEQMAVSIEILQVLKEKDLMTDDEISRIFSVTGDKDKLVEVYNTVFSRFVNYFARVKEMLEKGELPATPSAPPAENSAKADIIEKEDTSPAYIFPEKEITNE